MSKELIIGALPALNLYALIFDRRNGQVARTTTQVFEDYNSANYADYDVPYTEFGTNSNVYSADFPAWIPAGVYEIITKIRSGGSPVEADARVASGKGGGETFYWNGDRIVPLQNLAGRLAGEVVFDKTARTITVYDGGGIIGGVILFTLQVEGDLNSTKLILL